MTSCLGVELGPRSLRAVRLDGWRGRRTRVVETDWDPAGPIEAVSALREHLGRARRVAVAVRLPLLLTKRVRLPPLGPDERRDALRLEPQRYFPVRLEELVVAVRDDDLVFAAREASLAEWVRALEELGPVDLVEPGPVALVRALSRAGIMDGLALLDDAERGIGVVEISRGVITGIRRLYGPPGDAAAALRTIGVDPPRRVYLSPWDEDRARELAAELPDAVLEPLPTVRSVPAPFLSAYGAALGFGRHLRDALLPDELRDRIVARRRRSLVVAALAAVASVVFAFASLDAWRDGAVQRVAAEVRSLNPRAAPALALQRQVEALDRQARTLAGIQADRPDPLDVLLAVSRRLPPGASLRSLRLAGAEWQLDGYARQAGEVTQALAAAPEFRDVRLTSATNRAQIADRIYESFAVAFRLAPPP